MQFRFEIAITHWAAEVLPAPVQVARGPPDNHEAGQLDEEDAPGPIKPVRQLVPHVVQRPFSYVILITSQR